MNAVTAFEHRRQQLREQLEAAQDMQQAVLACTMALEQTACELAQDEQDEAARQRQQAVMAIVRRVPGLLQAGRAKGELVLAQEEKAEPENDRFGRGVQMAGVLMLCALAVYEYACGRAAVALLQALGALLFTAGFIRMRPAQQEEKSPTARGIAYADAQEVTAQLARLCEAADICAQDLAVIENANGRVRLSGTADDAMLDLLVALMEAKASGREAMAMRSLSLAEEYLHMLGVEIIAYSEKDAALFDMLPTMGQARTIRPALVQEGRLLRRGVAAVAAERSVGV